MKVATKTGNRETFSSYQSLKLFLQKMLCEIKIILCQIYSVE